jgi:hypothetical protein
MLALLPAVAAATGSERALPGHAGLLPDAVAPLHASLARADAVAIASVERVETGRIRLRDASALAGPVPERLSLKRSPSSPPPWSEGDRVLLLLRGARDPFVLVDLAHAETLEPRDEPRWREAIAALRTAGGSPDARRRAYAALLSGDAPAQQRLAAIGLAAADVAAPADPRLLRRLAALAAGSPRAAIRGPCARAALRTPAGTRRLLEQLPGEAGDPQVLTLALQAAGPDADTAGHAGAAILRALASDDAELRRAALAPGAALARSRPDASDALLPALGRVAAEDPEPALRDAARRALSAR